MAIDKHGIYIAPQLKKGLLVRVRQGVTGTRALTAAERNAWYESFHADCRAGRDVWYDDAGEPRLPPNVVDTSFTVGKCLIVTAALASPKRIGWTCTGRGKYCMVLDTVTGQEWLMNKRYLEVV